MGVSNVVYVWEMKGSVLNILHLIASITFTFTIKTEPNMKRCYIKKNIFNDLLSSLP